MESDLNVSFEDVAGKEKIDGIELKAMMAEES